MKMARFKPFGSRCGKTNLWTKVTKLVKPLGRKWHFTRKFITCIQHKVNISTFESNISTFESQKSAFFNIKSSISVKKKPFLVLLCVRYCNTITRIQRKVKHFYFKKVKKVNLPTSRLTTTVSFD
ncbi:hypothetical protein HanRHA438_Chr16g0766461 [Helianthus annuus]|nr:hypothetical protein HanRHA438_Chr16g0766461 [Helianthus annuus]